MKLKKNNRYLNSLFFITSFFLVFFICGVSMSGAAGSEAGSGINISAAAANNSQSTEQKLALDLYKNLQTANGLTTGLKIEVISSDKVSYKNDGRSLQLSSALIRELAGVDSGKALTVFMAREISYAENMRAGLSGTQLDALSDKASIIVCKNANIEVSPLTFNKMIRTSCPDETKYQNRLRALKLAASQYITPSDLSRMLSNKMRRGLTIKKGIDVDNINSVKGWQPILKNVAGGVVGNISVYYGLNVASNVLDGNSIQASLKKAAKSTFTTEYLVGGLTGSIVGGAVGSLIGGLIPVPGAGPILGAFISTAPALFGANLGAEIGSNVILDYKKNKSISVKRIYDNMDVSYLLGHSVGMAAGMAPGSALIPIPFVGGAIGGMIGGFLGSKISKGITSLFKSKKDEAKSKRGEVNLPWLKRGSSKESTETAESNAGNAVTADENNSDIVSVNPENKINGGVNSQELLDSQNQVKQAYQNYVNLLTQGCSDEIKINNALEKFQKADEKLRKLKKAE